jgi:F-type H+-transporting ATPase subunit alpha
MRHVAGTLRLELAQYRDLASFAQFASDLTPATRAQLYRGERLTALLKQPQYQPVPLEKQVVLLYAATKGLLDGVAIADLEACETDLYGFLDRQCSTVLLALAKGQPIDSVIGAMLASAIKQFFTLGLQIPAQAA